MSWPQCNDVITYYYVWVGVGVGDGDGVTPCISLPLR